MLKTIQLSDEALKYLEECISHGNKLMRQLLNLPLRDGVLWTLVSDETNGEALNEFRHGGVTIGTARGVIEKINDKLATFIIRHLSVSSSHYAIFEDYLRKPGSKLLTRDRYFVYDGDVCLFVPSESKGDLQDIKATMKNASRYTFRGILTSLGSGGRLTTGQSVDLPLIRELATSTNCILVGAYDEESYVIWERE
jgi:hypothetical protein